VDSLTSNDRLRGFREAAARYPDITLVDTVVGDYDRTTARTRVAQWLRDHPGQAPDACLTANDIMALGVIETLAGMTPKPAVVGINAIPSAIPAIKHGDLLATADFNAMRMAYLVTECAGRHLRGESMPARILLPVDLVDAGNCQLWDLPYAQRSVITFDELPATAKIA
jgi:ribose transport system substrate-binding protein